MAAPKIFQDDALLTIRTERQLRDDFNALCKLDNTTASAELRRFMTEYVESRRLEKRRA